MNHKAQIVEIFSSPQGEGVYVGERMTFVRFQRCNMRCKYCDTPQGLCHHEACRVETPAGSGNFIEIPNPVPVAKLCDLMSGFSDKMLSITGGEPLEQVNFLSEWLPSQTSMNKIMLETNGVHHDRLLQVLPYINVVSMDIKLPSSTGLEPKWNDHLTFLRNTLAGGIEIYVKLVVTGGTTDQDIAEAIRIITSVNRYIPTIIQPASQTLLFHEKISQSRLNSLERLCNAYLKDVRIIPQMHKQWGVL